MSIESEVTTEDAVKWLLVENEEFLSSVLLREPRKPMSTASRNSPRNNKSGAVSASLSPSSHRAWSPDKVRKQVLMKETYKNNSVAPDLSSINQELHTNIPDYDHLVAPPAGSTLGKVPKTNCPGLYSLVADEKPYVFVLQTASPTTTNGSNNGGNSINSDVSHDFTASPLFDDLFDRQIALGQPFTAPKEESIEEQKQKQRKSGEQKAFSIVERNEQKRLKIHTTVKKQGINLLGSLFDEEKRQKQLDLKRNSNTEELLEESIESWNNLLNNLELDIKKLTQQEGKQRLMRASGPFQTDRYLNVIIDKERDKIEASVNRQVELKVDRLRRRLMKLREASKGDRGDGPLLSPLTLEFIENRKHYLGEQRSWVSSVENIDLPGIHQSQEVQQTFEKNDYVREDESAQALDTAAAEAAAVPAKKLKFKNTKTSTLKKLVTSQLIAELEEKSLDHHGKPCQKLALARSRMFSPPSSPTPSTSSSPRSLSSPIASPHSPPIASKIDDDVSNAQVEVDDAEVDGAQQQQEDQALHQGLDEVLKPNAVDTISQLEEQKATIEVPEKQQKDIDDESPPCLVKDNADVVVIADREEQEVVAVESLAVADAILVENDEAKQDAKSTADEEALATCES